jgi:hypothetical protein
MTDLGKWLIFVGVFFYSLWFGPSVGPKAYLWFWQTARGYLHKEGQLYLLLSLSHFPADKPFADPYP